MWREDDFEDKGKQTRVAPRDAAAELVKETELPPDGESKRVDRQNQELNG